MCDTGEKGEERGLLERGGVGNYKQSVHWGGGVEGYSPGVLSLKQW